MRTLEDAERDLTAQIEKLRKAEEGGDANATAEIERLEGRRQAVLGLLDTLSQAEQQQLRFNQAFEAVSPAVNSLVGGLQEVVAGTKSAVYRDWSGQGFCRLKWRRWRRRAELRYIRSKYYGQHTCRLWRWNALLWCV